MKYVIKNKNTNMYYASDNYTLGCNHYVSNIEEARRFRRKMIALNVHKRFKHPENFEIIEIKELKKGVK